MFATKVLVLPFLELRVSWHNKIRIVSQMSIHVHTYHTHMAYVDIHVYTSTRVPTHIYLPTYLPT